jgi:hypothetical protein
MNPYPPHDDSAVETSCPKRLWVMMELADDELRNADDAPATGLRFHLSRCPSCRALAERMEAVRTELAAMASAEPDDDLLSRAESRVLADFQAVAGSSASQNAKSPATRRVPAESTALIEDNDESTLLIFGRRNGRRWLRRAMAAAAALGLIAGGWMLRALIVEPDKLSAPNSFDRWYIPDAGFASRGDVSEFSLPHPPPPGNPVNSDETRDAAALAAAGDDQDSLRICRFRSHEDAALWDDPRCAPAAMILPGPPDRATESPFSIDNSTRTLSTGSASQRR